MFRYAIFDFDGTLADTGAGVFASVQYALRSMGEPELDSETLKYFIGPSARDELFRQVRTRQRTLSRGGRKIPRILFDKGHI